MLVYFLTWTTYGTWLRGDERGWNAGPERGPGPEAPDRTILEGDRARLKHPPTVLNKPMREAVDRAVVGVAEHRGWTIGALSVRSNHIHAVVQAGATPEKVMNDFKSWSTRRLRESGLVEPHHTVWTRHGSTRYLNSNASILAAVDYVERFQDDRAGRFSTGVRVLLDGTGSGA